MRSVRFSAAVSMDGYIAGPRGEHDWIVMDPDIDFRALMARFDAVLMGRKSFEQAQRLGGFNAPGVTSYVFSRTLRQEDCKGAIVAADLQETVAALKAEQGKDIWLFGGGELLRSMLDLRLVDSIELSVIPVVLGRGLPLYPQAANRVRFRLASHRVYPTTGTVFLEYLPV